MRADSPEKTEDIPLLQRITFRVAAYSILLIFLIMISLLSAYLLISVSEEELIEETELFGNVSIEQTQDVVEEMSRNFIEHEAYRTEELLHTFLKENPSMSYDELREDTVFRSLALNTVGETGYSAVHTRDGINIMHPNPDIEGYDLSRLSDELPEFWDIIEMSLVKEASGFYDWADEDGIVRPKYMHCVPVEDSELVVCATTYLDEFYSPAESLERFMALSMERTKQSIYERFNDTVIFFIMIFLVIMMAIIFVSFITVKRIVVPINKLQDVTDKVKEGNFDARAEVKVGGEIRQLAERFNETLDALSKMDSERKQLEKAKTEFLSITSHELRSPMTPMKAQMQMLLKGYYGKLNKKQKEALDITLRNTDRLDKIIMDLLEVSRIEAGRLKFRFRKVDLKDHIERLVEEMKGFKSEKNINIKADIGDIPEIETDPDRIMQVLRNLLNNALKFSPKNSEINIKVRTAENGIMFKVKDEGMGMTKKDAANIFEPFYQVEHSLQRKEGGTGLGLTICRGIITSQNGRIWAESSPGKGTTFYFTVPFEPVKEIKPLKLMFSGRAIMEDRIKELFRNMFGPVGLNEFEDLKSRQELDSKHVMGYIDYLQKSGVISKNDADSAKSRAESIFTSTEQDMAEKAGAEFENRISEFFSEDKNSERKNKDEAAERKTASEHSQKKENKEDRTGKGKSN
ncbi:HAMP domain-containing protein [Candidatus Woesearchaeota archaeon]|nr:HAMP domain-containing protein [Candidatus Woesearchaeota archaeon]